jgi:hypothetical protein
METLLRHIELLARREDLRGLSQGFRGRSVWDNAPQTITIACVLLVVVVAMLIIGRLSVQYEQRQATNSASGLFKELCRIHKLNYSTRRLLKRLAAYWGLESPAILFIEPTLLAPEKLPAEWQREAEQITALRRQLFDTP